MSIKKREYDEDGFKAIMYTLFCDTTEKKMLDIIARDEDVDEAPVTSISASWVPGSLGEGSGSHELTGLLSYGPIDDATFKTEVLDISATENEEGSLEVNVYVTPNEEM